jgi:hypothetical protein
MPKLRRQKLPRALIQHLSLRIRQREISIDQMGLFGEWCDTDPEVPEGEWYKLFPGMPGAQAVVDSLIVRCQQVTSNLGSYPHFRSGGDHFVSPMTELFDPMTHRFDPMTDIFDPSSGRKDA